MQALVFIYLKGTAKQRYYGYFSRVFVNSVNSLYLGYEILLYNLVYVF
jgi:hypothetical protein